MIPRLAAEAERVASVQEKCFVILPTLIVIAYTHGNLLSVSSTVALPLLGRLLNKASVIKLRKVLGSFDNVLSLVKVLVR